MEHVGHESGMSRPSAKGNARHGDQNVTRYTDHHVCLEHAHANGKAEVSAPSHPMALTSMPLPADVSKKLFLSHFYAGHNAMKATLREVAFRPW